MKKIYLDYAATTPVDPQVLKKMQPYFFKKFGNPSSIHSFGQEARKAVEYAREETAQFLGARPEEIVFTSGGTESNNFALIGIAYALEEKGRHIVISRIEHHTVLEPCNFLKKRGFKITCVGVDKYGMVDPEEVRKALTDKTILVSLMHANNEIGTIQPVKDVAKISGERGIYFHTDAVQTVGHILTKVNDLGVDLLSLSAHKFYGPKGVGALYIRKGTRIEKFLHGGDQENGRRASTHNTAGIVGLGAALKLCSRKMSKEADLQIRLRDSLINGLEKAIPGVYLNGHPLVRLPNNVNISIKDTEAETVLVSLDMQGIAASSGSACTSTSQEASHVLLATGLKQKTAYASLRFSLGRWTKYEDIDYLMEHLPKIVARQRNIK